MKLKNFSFIPTLLWSLTALVLTFAVFGLLACASDESSGDGLTKNERLCQSPKNKTDFMSVWQTDNMGETEGPDGNNLTSLRNQLQLPLVENGTYNFTVDWGDNSSNKITDYDSDLDNNGPDRTHTYAKAGEYVVTIAGTIEGWSFGYIEGRRQPGGGTSDFKPRDAKKLKRVCQWGSLVLGDTEAQFFKTGNFIVPTNEAPDLSKTSSFSFAFSGSEFNQNINHWEVYYIEDFSSAFYAADKFNQPLNTWDVSNATDFKRMFNSSSAFNQDVSSWDVSSGENFTGMFDSNDTFDPEFAENESNWQNWFTKIYTDKITCGNMFDDNLSDSFGDFLITLELIPPGQKYSHRCGPS